MTDIKTLNDNFRKTFTGGQVLLTAGIDSMSLDDKANIKKEKAGKCLYFNNEVSVKSGVVEKLQSPEKEKEYKKKIFDCNIGNCSWAFSKSAFAKLVDEDVEFIKDFDFSNFRLIFDKIKEILALP